MIRVYLALGAIVALSLLLWRLSWLDDALDKERARTDELSNALAAEIKEHNQAQDARERYLTELETAKNESNRLKNCIADRTCVATIRVRVPASCPAAESGSAAGAESTTAELDPALRQDYFNLRDGIIGLEAAHGLCLDTLKRWATK